MLASNANEVFCVSDIARKIGISQPAVSQHLRVLKSIGLLDANRKGCRVFYTINLDVFQEYKNRMDEMFKKAFKNVPTNFHVMYAPIISVDSTDIVMPKL